MRCGFRGEQLPSMQFWGHGEMILGFFSRFYSFIWEKEHESGVGGEGQRERDKRTRMLSREPHAGLDPRTMRSQPKPKADA